MERPARFALALEPWRGPVLLLHHGRLVRPVAQASRPRNGLGWRGRTYTSPPRTGRAAITLSPEGAPAPDRTVSFSLWERCAAVTPPGQSFGKLISRVLFSTTFL